MFAAGTLVAVGGCSGEGAPAQPDLAPEPLRRLSDVEYLATLRDLFPTLSPVLPALPPDVPVAGFENAAEAQEPSDVLIARYEGIADLYAQAAAGDTAVLSSLSGCTDPVGQQCDAQLVSGAGRRIFRRPLTADESGRYLARFLAWEQAIDFTGAAQ